MDSSRSNSEIRVGEVNSISTSDCCTATCVSTVVCESNTFAEEAVPIAGSQISLEDGVEIVDGVFVNLSLVLIFNFRSVALAQNISQAPISFLCGCDSVLEILNGLTFSCCL